MGSLILNINILSSFKRKWRTGKFRMELFALEFNVKDDIFFEMSDDFQFCL